jgi:protocatechuate 3,4-dioxygenase, beta subunit
VRQQPTNETAGLRQEDTGQPPYLYPDYVATRLRAPKKPLIILPRTLSDTMGPAYGSGPIGELDNDLTRQHEGEPLGERIIPSSPPSRTRSCVTP